MKGRGSSQQQAVLTGPLFVPDTANAITASLANSATGHNKDENVIAFDAYNQAYTKDVSKTVAARNDQDTASCVAYPINTQLGLRGPDTSNTTREGLGVGGEDDPAYTLPAKHSHAVAFAQNTRGEVRRLTPVECERLQGFPDNFTAIPWRKKEAADCPDGPRYKALGNSMAVPVMRWIGERIQLVDDLISVL